MKSSVVASASKTGSESGHPVLATKSAFYGAMLKWLFPSLTVTFLSGPLGGGMKCGQSLSVQWRSIAVCWKRKLITVSLTVGGYAHIDTFKFCCVKHSIKERFLRC